MLQQNITQDSVEDPYSHYTHVPTTNVGQEELNHMHQYQEHQSHTLFHDNSGIQYDVYSGQAMYYNQNGIATS